jgi:hypothetical protein
MSSLLPESPAIWEQFGDDERVLRAHRGMDTRRTHSWQLIGPAPVL